MFDLILFFLSFLDQQVFMIIIPSRLGGCLGYSVHIRIHGSWEFVRYAGGMLDDVTSG